MAGKLRPGRSFYIPKRVLTNTEVLDLDVAGVALLAFKRAGDPNGSPALRILRPPADDADERTRARWSVAQASRVSGPEFVALLDDMGLRVIEDDGGYHHINYNAKGREKKNWELRLTGTTVRRRKR